MAETLDLSGTHPTTTSRASQAIATSCTQHLEVVLLTQYSLVVVVVVLLI
jgi:hypothetical protein